MSILKQLDYRPCADEHDPDDYRPRSSWAAAVDPATPDGRFVQNLCVFVDVVAPGDRVPLHTHPIDELVVVLEGTAEVTLDEETHVVQPGAVIFIPERTPHGARNTGDEPAKLIGLFPSERVGFRYLERNPAPGTEADLPQPPFEMNVREEVEAGPI